MEQIGKRMKQLREVYQLSQAELAKLCGSNQATIAKMETGKTAPSLKILIWMADYFDVSMDYLCCRTNQPEGKLYQSRPNGRATREEMQEFINMCFDPASPYNGKLKDALFQILEESRK